MWLFPYFQVDKPPALWYFIKALLTAVLCGEVSEWLMEAVLKTVEQQCSVGSNPTLSAILESVRPRQDQTIESSVRRCHGEVLKW